MKPRTVERAYYYSLVGHRRGLQDYKGSSASELIGSNRNPKWKLVQLPLMSRVMLACRLVIPRDGRIINVDDLPSPNLMLFLSPSSEDWHGAGVPDAENVAMVSASGYDSDIAWVEGTVVWDNRPAMMFVIVQPSVIHAWMRYMTVL